MVHSITVFDDAASDDAQTSETSSQQNATTHARAHDRAGDQPGPHTRSVLHDKSVNGQKSLGPLLRKRKTSEDYPGYENEITFGTGAQHSSYTEPWKRLAPRSHQIWQVRRRTTSLGITAGKDQTTNYGECLATSSHVATQLENFPTSSYKSWNDSKICQEASAKLDDTAPQHGLAIEALPSPICADLSPQPQSVPELERSMASFMSPPASHIPLENATDRPCAKLDVIDDASAYSINDEPDYWDAGRANSPFENEEFPMEQPMSHLTKSLQSLRMTYTGTQTEADSADHNQIANHVPIDETGRTYDAQTKCHAGTVQQYPDQGSLASFPDYRHTDDAAEMSTVEEQSAPNEISPQALQTDFAAELSSLRGPSFEAAENPDSGYVEHTSRDRDMDSNSQNLFNAYMFAFSDTNESLETGGEYRRDGISSIIVPPLAINFVHDCPFQFPAPHGENGSLYPQGFNGFAEHPRIESIESPINGRASYFGFVAQVSAGKSTFGQRDRQDLAVSLDESGFPSPISPFPPQLPAGSLNEASDDASPETRTVLTIDTSLASHSHATSLPRGTRSFLSPSPLDLPASAPILMPALLYINTLTPSPSSAVSDPSYVDLQHFEINIHTPNTLPATPYHSVTVCRVRGCGARFAGKPLWQVTSLRRHMRHKHRGIVVTYQCDMCRKNFSRKDNRRKHQLDHHGYVQNDEGGA